MRADLLHKSRSPGRRGLLVTVALLVGFLGSATVALAVTAQTDEEPVHAERPEDYVPALAEDSQRLPLTDALGNIVLDESGRIAILDLTKVGPLHEQVREANPGGVAKDGTDLMIRYSDHTAELEKMGALTYVEPTPDVLERYCSRGAVDAGQCKRPEPAKSR